MAGLSDILSALQQGVSAINGVTQQLASIFPSATGNSTKATPGTIAFTSSQAGGFFNVTTSSGANVRVPYYFP